MIRQAVISSIAVIAGDKTMLSFSSFQGKAKMPAAHVQNCTAEIQDVQICLPCVPSELLLHSFSWPLVRCYHNTPRSKCKETCGINREKNNTEDKLPTDMFCLCGECIIELRMILHRFVQIRQRG